MNWEPHAAKLADQVIHQTSRWRAPLATTPRHLFVPRWWERRDERWALHDGPADEERWLDTAYSDTSIVTSVGPLHSDHAAPGDQPTGSPTS